MRVVVAMSGGVDSSVAAALLVEAGHEVIGLTMNVWDYGRDACDTAAGRACCSPSDIEDARQVCRSLGIRFYPMNFRDAFRSRVVGPFIDAYLRGETPNPCVLCNSVLKFDQLLRQAEAIEADAMATGHYAQLLRGEDEKIHLLRAVDRPKDQSYFLFGITPRVAARLLFPLGGLTKPEVRGLAERFGLRVAAKRESQDACFAADGSYAELIAADPRAAETGEGDIVDLDGRVVGRHDGFWRFTIGQRRGLAVAAGERIYVVRLEPEHNRVVIGPETALFRSELTLRDLSLVAEESLSDGMTLHCQIRSRHHAAPATLHGLDGGPLAPGASARVVFERPQSAITPGQAAVLYRGDEVLGGGWITEAGR
ncbi:MAG: tRNA 2-thiouridine(34) synthase MnmA [Myxococcales bacterium]|nr:MAG: tRNA 2-thiouridine(34) synthase MnmA [Myxococcales bacterium]